MTNFDAAIKCLKESFGMMSKSEYEEAKHEIDSAIRVLEAAGLIDEDDYFWAGRGSVSRNTIDLLAVIIAELPDTDE